MSFMTKIKLWFIGILTLCVLIGYFVLNTEFVQKKLFDVKADLVGSHRTVTFYTKVSAEKVASYTDKDMRFEAQPYGVISVWLGSQNKKVNSTLEYIIEDVK